MGAWPVGVCHTIATFRGMPALIYGGLGNPRQFRRMVVALGVHVVDGCVFRDHVTYTASTLRTIARSVERSHPDVVLTTEKDLVKCPSRWSLAVPVFAISLAVEFVEGRSRLEASLAGL